MSEYIDKVRFDTEKAENFFAQRLAYTLGPVELKEMLAANKVKLIDVRYSDDFKQGHIPGAISIEKKNLLENLCKFSVKDVHVVYCYNQQCHLASSAAFVMAKNGYPVMELEGGFDVWVNKFKFDVER